MATDDNSMDVDDVPRTPLPSVLKNNSPSSLASPFEYSPPVSLSHTQMDELNRQMTEASKSEDWPDRLISVGNDKKKLQNVFISVVKEVMSETAALQKISRSQATKLVQSLNDNEVEELKNIVQNGDWVCLITHRMWLAHF
jgi:hypothetical protein